MENSWKILIWRNSLFFNLHNDPDALQVALSQGVTVIPPGTSCIFASSGHLTQGVVVEIYCSGSTWVVTMVEESQSYKKVYKDSTSQPN